MLRQEMEKHRLSLTRTDWTGNTQLVPYDHSVTNNPQITVSLLSIVFPKENALVVWLEVDSNYWLLALVCLPFFWDGGGGA